MAGAFCPGLSWASDISFLHSQVLCLHSTQQGEAVHFPESLTILWVHSEMRGTQKTDHASMGRRDNTAFDLVRTVLWDCTRANGRFWSIKVFKNGVYIQLDVTKSPKSEKWSAVITQSSRALSWYAVEYFNLHFSLTGKLLGSLQIY